MKTPYPLEGKILPYSSVKLRFSAHKKKQIPVSVVCLDSLIFFKFRNLSYLALFDLVCPLAYCLPVL